MSIAAFAISLGIWGVTFNTGASVVQKAQRVAVADQRDDSVHGAMIDMMDDPDVTPAALQEAR